MNYRAWSLKHNVMERVWQLYFGYDKDNVDLIVNDDNYDEYVVMKSADIYDISGEKPVELFEGDIVTVNYKKVINKETMDFSITGLLLYGRPFKEMYTSGTVLPETWFIETNDEIIYLHDLFLNENSFKNNLLLNENSFKIIGNMYENPNLMDDITNRKGGKGD